MRGQIGGGPMRGVGVGVFPQGHAVLGDQGESAGPFGAGECPQTSLASGPDTAIARPKASRRGEWPTGTVWKNVFINDLCAL